jgi:two-component system LytT family response regulator
MENSGIRPGAQRMTVATAGRVDMVNVDHLVRIEAQSNYSKLHFDDGKTLTVAKVLRKFEEQLRQDRFIRTHKTHLVNLQFIRSFEGRDQNQLLLENGESIRVARSKKRMVLQRLMNLQAV